MGATTDVTARSQHVRRQGDHQQAGGADVYRLKIPVARPKPLAHCSAGRHRKKEQRQQRQHPSVFVNGGGRLDMLEDQLVGAER